MRLLKIKPLCTRKFSPFLITLKDAPYKPHISSQYSTLSAVGDSSNNRTKFIDSRSNLFDKLKSEYYEKLKAKVSVPIEIKLSGGNILEGSSWQTTPSGIYEKIDKKLASDAIVARVNNELWDLNRPLEKDSKVELLKFDDPDAQEVFRHSSAHVLGSALELLYESLLITGPVTENGFFYDIFHPERKVSINH